VTRYRPPRNAPAESWTGSVSVPDARTAPLVGSSAVTAAVEVFVASSPPSATRWWPSVRSTSRETGAGSWNDAGAMWSTPSDAAVVGVVGGAVVVVGDNALLPPPHADPRIVTSAAAAKDTK